MVAFAFDFLTFHMDFPRPIWVVEIDLMPGT
jgi:hypothetical protein